MLGCSFFRRVVPRTILALILILVWPVGSVAAYTEVSRTSVSEPVAEGVTMQTINMKTTEGPLNIYVETVDLTNPYVKVDTMVGTGGVITKTQNVTKMAQETGAVAGINGDFFDMQEGAPTGLIVQSGQLVSSPAQRTDMYGFGLTKNNTPVFPVFNFQGTVTAPTGSQFQLFGINKPSYLAYLPDKNPSTDANRLNMYTPRWGAKSRGALPGLPGVVEMVVDNDTVTEMRVDQPGTVIPPYGYILAGQGSAAQFLTSNFKVGDPVQVNYSVSPETDNLSAAIGGMALIVDQGKRHWFTQSIPGKLARTAIGASQDGTKLYLVVVEGGKSSRGMTMEELADFMASLGVWTAVNVDGGGSTTMVVRHLGDQTASLLNKPVNSAQRNIPDGLGIYSTAPAGAFAGMVLSGPRYVMVGTKKDFTAKGYDEHFNPYSINPDDITWEVSPALGTFQGSAFTASQSGDGIVRATYDGITQEYPIKVLGSNDIAKVEVTPETIAINPGDSVTISVKVTTKQGAVFVLQPGEYDVQITGDVGTISGSKFTAGDRMAVGQLNVKIDGTVVPVKVSVGGIEKPLYGFETAKVLKYRGFPTDIPGSFRLTTVGEPTFRGAGAARLAYDFTKATGTRASYGSFDGGLTLPGQPMGLGLWVKGDEGNGHWLRARIVDANGTEKLIDFSQEVNWQGWQHVKAIIPPDVKFPVKLTDIYMVETDGTRQDKGVIYIDELTEISAPAAGETVDQPSELTQQGTVLPGSVSSIQLGSDMGLTISNEDKSVYSVTARQVWTTELPTPGYNPVMPLYNITAEADGDELNKLNGSMKIQIGVKDKGNLNKARLMYWDEDQAAWLQVPSVADAAKGVITARTSETGLFALMMDARPQPVFTDIGSSWAKDLITDMAARKLVSGYPDGRFLPAKGVSRAEFITLLGKTLGWQAETTNIEFKDAIPAWAQGSIAAAVNRGVVKGYSNGTFQPGKVITRAEMAVMIDKALGLADSSQPSNYGDARLIPSWAVQSIRNTKVTGLMQGSNNRFRPGDVANRAEATAVVANILNYYVNAR